jgi:putative DNA primase/helicase
MTEHLVQAALSYAKRGWRILPLHYPTVDAPYCSCAQPDCSSPGKHPRTARGVLDATTHTQQIISWWKRWPHSNIGIATGHRSNLFVLDIDDPASVPILEERLSLALPQTLRANTSRGMHLYFHYSANLRNRAGLVPGIDIRAEGGYVVAPPSVHPSGTLYEWANQVEILDAPQRLLSLILGNATPRPVAGKLDTYQQSALQKANEAIRSASPGTRNDTLNKEAYSLAGLPIPKDILYNQLAESARIAGLSQREIQQTLLSAISKGQARPRTDQRASKGPSDHREQSRGLPEAARFKCTDSGNAERFAARHGDKLRYVTEWEKWFFWNGARWSQDRTSEVGRLAKDTVRSIYSEAANSHNEDQRKFLSQWAQKSESAEKRSSMQKLAAIEPEIPLLPERLDANPWLLNCPNGTLDLRSGVLQKHLRTDYITKCTAVAYHPNATCPQWLQFLSQVTNKNQNLIQFLQRSVGYALTGDTREQCLFFLHGTGRNGKSTFLETLLRLFADYSQKAEMSTFLSRNNEGPRNDIAVLRGARMVAASEADGGKRLAESLIKEITGGDTIRARFLFKESFEFKPQFKLFLAANYKPQIRGTDDGIWRRIRLVPFTVTIPPEEVDKNLPQKLVAELAGILAWAVEGCLQWQQTGLGEPQEVLEATADYREEMDVLGDFLGASCTVSPEVRCYSRELYKAYRFWSEAQHTEPLSETSFSVRLSGKGFAKKRTKKGFLWAGIGLLHGDAAQSCDA